MALNNPKSRNIEYWIPLSTAAGDCPSLFAISRLVIPEKNASSIMRCCRDGIASSVARTSRRCSVMLIEKAGTAVELLLPFLL